MRPEELADLRKPFPAGDKRPPDRQFRDALGLSVPHVRTLLDELHGDLDTSNHGIGWWKGALSLQQNILIADQLVLSTGTIETNLVEARLHMLEAFDHIAQYSANNPYRVFRSPDGNFHPNIVPQTDAASHLSQELAITHVAGFFRALGSAIDCASTAAVGVAGLPMGILKSGYGQVAGLFSGTGKNRYDNTLHRDLWVRLEAVTTEAGKKGWLRWSLAYRHMLLHRGRHRVMWTAQPTGGDTEVGQGWKLLWHQLVMQLSRDPSRGEIDNWRDNKKNPQTLNEDALVTIKGLWDSAQKMINGWADELSSFWRRRRDNPQLLPQPVQQWSDSDIPEVLEFTGCDPGPEVQGRQVMLGSPSMVERLHASGVGADGAGPWAGDATKAPPTRS